MGEPERALSNIEREDAAAVERKARFDALELKRAANNAAREVERVERARLKAFVYSEKMRKDDGERALRIKESKEARASELILRSKTKFDREAEERRVREARDDAGESRRELHHGDRLSAEVELRRSHVDEMSDVEMRKRRSKVYRLEWLRQRGVRRFAESEVQNQLENLWDQEESRFNDLLHTEDQARTKRLASEREEKEKDLNTFRAESQRNWMEKLKVHVDVDGTSSPKP